MPQLLAVAKLKKASGMPNDTAENTFAFACSTAVAVAAPSIAEKLHQFYCIENTTQTRPLWAWLAASVSDGATGLQVDVYDITAHLNGSPHGSPVYTQTFDPNTSGPDSLPDEVAVCLSYHSAYGTDVEFGPATRPRARDRGRIFFGPLMRGAVEEDGITSEPFPATNLRLDLKAAATTLMGDGTGEAETWSVWSRTDATLKAVVGGWIDNAFDTQRRRGNAPDFRNIWP